MRTFALILGLFLALFPVASRADSFDSARMIKASHQTWDVIETAVKEGKLSSRDGLGYYAEVTYAFGLINARQIFGENRPQEAYAVTAQAHVSLDCSAKYLLARGVELPDLMRSFVAWVEGEKNRLAQQLTSLRASGESEKCAN